MQSLNEEQEASADSYFWNEQSSLALLDTFKKLIESGMAVVEIKNPKQITTVHKVLKFIEEALSTLAKKTNNFKENPMKKHHVKWLEAFKGVISAVVWQLNLLLGSQMQNQIAYNSLPTLLAIMDTIRKLFNAYATGDKKT